MSAQDYACVTVRGRAPWGFQLRQGDTEPHRRVQVHQVEEGSHASIAGLCEDDELVSVNGVACSSLSLAEVIVLIEKATDCLQLLVKRCCLFHQQKSQSVNTTLQASWRELREPYKSKNVDEAHYGEINRNTECPAGNTMVRTQFCIPASKDRARPETYDSNDGGPRLEITPGSVVELQLSLSQTTLEDTGCTSLGSARGVMGDLCHQTNTENDPTTSAPGCSFYIPLHEREPLGQRGVLVSSPSALLGQVEVTIQPSGRDSRTERVGAGGTEATANEQQDYTEGEGGHTDEDPTSFSVSFGIPSEEEDSESERELNKPNKHRARHARLRRSESLSEKQVKEAKSKCKRIALLLTAAATNPNNKGLLMFKKHRQRAKQYTLVSYGTGENEPEFEDENDEYNDKETHAVEFTVLATSETEIDEDFFTNSSGHKNIVTFDLDTGLLEIERKLYNQEDMNALPDTKGKGALMFAQRRQRIDEISAEHEDMRSKGIPVESIQEAEKSYQQANLHSCIQTNDSQNYTDVSVHHQQQHQQYQQYQEQHYQQQQQQQYQEFQQQMQYHQQQQHYQQQQECQQGQQYQSQQCQQQQQVQQYFHKLNGVSSHQTNVVQSSVINRSAKPFLAQTRAEAPFSPSANQDQSYYSDGQGEQIASRDERISVPAIKTGILQDTRRKNKAKPMFTFKEPQKVSPNPELLNLLNRNDKRAGFDSGTEEDYLSLGAEACNFLQSSKIKNKTPPPVAPKPHIHPVTPPWSPQPEIASQQFHQDTGNNIPVTTKDPVSEMGSSAIPEEEPSTAHAADQNEASTKIHLQVQPEAVNAWGLTETQIQSGQQIDTWHENQSQPQLHAKPEPAVSSWAPSSTQALEQPPVTAWGPAEVPSQVPAQNQSQMQPPWVTQSQVLSEVQPPTAVQTQSPSQPSWVTQSQPQHQPHPESQINTWVTAPTQSPHQPPWAQSPVPGQASVSTWPQDLNQPQVQLSWAQHQQESQPIPAWTASQQHPQSPWIQPQSQPQPQPTWVSQTQQQTPINTWNQSQSLVQTQHPWTHQTQPSSQPPAQIQQQQNPWTSVPPQSQPHPAWAPQPQEHPQQTMNLWTPEQNKTQPPWNQPQSPAQAQPPWSHPPQQQTPPQSQSQTVISTWTPRPQQGPVITMGSPESQKLAQPVKPWSPPQITQPPPPHQLNSNTPRSKVPSHITGMPGMGSASGMGPAFEMPALRGKGAELFAKRQSRMEKYVVDSSTVQANKARSLSPSPSLPGSWKYSPNCRAPPPLAYNPLQSPSYPLGAIKQPPSSSPSSKNKNKVTDKQKPAPKPLNVLDVMKHQPYQLNSSLFTYGPAAEKLAAEKEAAAKLAAQKAAQAQAQVQSQAQAPDPYAFIPQQPQPPQQPYSIPVPSPAMHDDPYHHTPNSYQPTANAYQQVPYQQIYNQPHSYQQPPSNSYQQSPSIPYQQPPPYQAGPYPASQAPCYQPTPTSYVVPTCPGRAESATGSIIPAAPKPKFSAKKSDAQALGRSSSLSPPVRLSPLGYGSRSASVSPSPTPLSHTTPLSSYTSRSTERQVFWLEKGRKPPTPWEAASRHPLGLVDEAFAHQDIQHSIASNLRSAAHRKMLPEPPAEWKAKVAYEPPPKSQGWRMNQSSLSFLSPTKSTASAPAAPAPYGSPLRQSQPPRSMTEASLAFAMSGLQCRRPLGQSVYRSRYSNT